mmetsp:Transcript_102792/g.297173  ORF Transcript_102792/g.297173 Transcript_102792/m.297173 type:complete len:202 (-) Transcript_102792:354-959(-)
MSHIVWCAQKPTCSHSTMSRLDALSTTRSRMFDVTSSWSCSSSGVGALLKRTVFTTDSANRCPSACTASTSQKESPNETKFVTLEVSNCLPNSRKAWVFQLAVSSGKCGSKRERAEMIGKPSSSGSALGRYNLELCCTQPSSALVTMSVWPNALAFLSNLRTLEATTRSRRDVSNGRSWCPRRLMNEVQSNVSSQSKKITV